MENYPEKWKWTNGIQKKRARIILSPACLVWLEVAAEHRRWRNRMPAEHLDNQMHGGAIIEELVCASLGMFGKSTNKDGGNSEVTLIFRNGEPISDMFYTSNFAIFSLNEAALVIPNPENVKVGSKLAELFVRVQAKSEKYDELDGKWFRAFEFDKWDYWTSNAYHVWGTWGTHPDWTQSAIISSLAMFTNQQSFWNLTAKSRIKLEMQISLDQMF